MSQAQVNPSPNPNPLTLLSREKRLLYVLVGVQFANVVDFMVMMPLGPMLAREMGINTAQFGLLVSAYTLAGAFSGLFCAFLIERFERKRFLLTVFGLFIAATFACALAQSFYSLLVARALTGVFGGALGAVVNVVVADHIPASRRGQAMGLLGMAFSLSTVFGVPVALWSANQIDVLGWRTPFFAVSFIGIILAVLALRFLPQGSVRAHSEASWLDQLNIGVVQIRDCLADKNHVRGLLLTMCVIATSFMVIPYLTIYATHNVGVAESKLPLMYFLGGLCTLVTSRAIGRWADRFGKLKTFRVMALLATIPLVTITQLGVTPLEIYLCVTTLFFILVNGRVVVSQALTASAASAPSRGVYMSLASCAANLSLGLSTFFGGLVISADANGNIIDFHLLGYASVCLTFIAIWLANKLVQRG